MIRVEVIPPEFDLSRPVKRRESAAASRDSIDIFTGKNQRLKSRYRRVDPRSIVGQRGSGDTNETDFRIVEWREHNLCFRVKFGFFPIARLGNNAVTEHRRVHVPTFVAICVIQ